MRKKFIHIPIEMVEDSEILEYEQLAPLVIQLLNDKTSDRYYYEQDSSDKITEYDRDNMDITFFSIELVKEAEHPELKGLYLNAYLLEV